MSGDGDSRRRIVRISIWTSGILPVVGWVWALALAFVPQQIYPGDFFQDCGVPAFFDRGHVVESGTDGVPAPAPIVDECERVVDQKMREATGTALLTAPVAAVWVAAAARLSRR